MTEIEKIQRYIKRTGIPLQTCVRYSMGCKEWLALAHHGPDAVLDAVALAFDYGQAKGYRAAMSERKAVRG